MSFLLLFSFLLQIKVRIAVAMLETDIRNIMRTARRGRRDCGERSRRKGEQKVEITMRGQFLVAGCIYLT